MSAETPQPTELTQQSTLKKIGLLGDSRKLTCAVVLIGYLPFVALMFDKWEVAATAQNLFWNGLEPLIYMYFGAQGGADIMKEVGKGIAKIKGKQPEEPNENT